MAWVIVIIAETIFAREEDLFLGSEEKYMEF